MTPNQKQAETAREAIRVYQKNPNVTTKWWAIKEIRKVENMSMRYHLREIADLNRI